MMKGLLEIQIKFLRKKMEEMAQRKGLTDPEVIAISQEIDLLHNQWNLLFGAMDRGVVPFISGSYWNYAQAELWLGDQGKL
jgi:hypothetical protein